MLTDSIRIQIQLDEHVTLIFHTKELDKVRGFRAFLSENSICPTAAECVTARGAIQRIKTKLHKRIEELEKILADSAYIVILDRIPIQREPKG